MSACCHLLFISKQKHNMPFITVSSILPLHFLFAVLLHFVPLLSRLADCSDDGRVSNYSIKMPLCVPCMFVVRQTRSCTKPGGAGQLNSVHVYGFSCRSIEEVFRSAVLNLTVDAPKTYIASMRFAKKKQLPSDHSVFGFKSVIEVEMLSSPHCTQPKTTASSDK